MMHFSIPDTAEHIDTGGGSFTVFNIHINGVPHCSVRYRQFHNFFEELKREFGTNAIPPFPPKKLFSLSPLQLEERRLGLERFVQQISQEHAIATSNTFNHFLLTAQQETLKEKSENVTLDVYLMNGHKLTVNIISTDQRDDVLEAVAAQIDLSEEFVYYFGLFLVRKEPAHENEIVRKLQEFESPYISLKAASRSQPYCIVLRKSYWDARYDDDLIDDRIALNLLYIQAVCDIERGWVVPSKEQQKQLSLLRQRGSKKEFLHLAQTVKYYGYLQFRSCYTDFSSGTRILISAGNKELIFRQQTSGEMKEVTFRVTRMRCWRITSTMLYEDIEAAERRTSPTDPLPCSLELAFEYLFGKDNLKWVTIKSDQAILMSMSLQAMVDELIRKKNGERIKRPQDRRRIGNGRIPSHLKKESSSYSLKSPTASTPEAEAGGILGKEITIKSISDKISAVTLKGPASNQMEDASGLMTENDAFEGIGDDDL